MSIEKTVKKTPQQQQQQSRPGGPGGRPCLLYTSPSPRD